MSTQTNVRLSKLTKDQIAGLRTKLGLSSDAQVIMVAIDRLSTAKGATRPKIHTKCPYCSSPQTQDSKGKRFYACGTTADRDSAVYKMGCES